MPAALSTLEQAAWPSGPARSSGTATCLKTPLFDDRDVPPDLPRGAAAGSTYLEQAYQRWRDRIAALDDAGLQAPLGPKGAHVATILGATTHHSRLTVTPGEAFLSSYRLYEVRALQSVRSGGKDSAWPD